MSSTGKGTMRRRIVSTASMTRLSTPPETATPTRARGDNWPVCIMSLPALATQVRWA